MKQDSPLVFVDVETTGMHGARDYVTEIAAIRMENNQIVSEIRSLIKPPVSIPYRITQVTGINDGMVADAPIFKNISDDLMQVLDGAILIAHNVRFDYSFLKNEFSRISVPYSPKMIDTVSLSRHFYPEQVRHRLADVIYHHGFEFTNRHRAYDDAFVLVQFYKKLIKQFSFETVAEASKIRISKPSIPRYIDPDMIAKLPNTPGVYIFEDESNAALYVGKSIDIKKRVLSHFTRDTAESKEFKISQSIRNIRYVETGGELAALLHESELVKQLQPIHNRRLRRTKLMHVIKYKIDNNGYKNLEISSLAPEDMSNSENIVSVHARKPSAKNSLIEAVNSFELCSKLCGLEKTTGACFRYQLGKCKGACIRKEPAEKYNSRVDIIYAERGIDIWPYDGPVVVREKATSNIQQGFVISDWIVTGKVTVEDNMSPTFTSYESVFDYDAYRIVRGFLISKVDRLLIEPYTGQYE